MRESSGLNLHNSQIWSFFRTFCLIISLLFGQMGGGKIEYFQFTSWVSGKNRRSARYPAGPLAQGAVAVPRIYRKRLRLLSLLSLLRLLSLLSLLRLLSLLCPLRLLSLLCPLRFLPCPFGTGVGSLPNQRPLGSASVRERPGLPYEILISTYLAAETQLLPDLS